ncbi:hypothetical protein NLI96_g9133 [Meripilus lineatus]|uniref:MARVEL domain-containing protein n=1 Tax=Meripilus lineatus TaxID=2056292 RepID=A0AAD5YFK0_9APHY|nr:hypothetical protein NLI96_g9133 [Physisporinus lineatus]
MLNFNPTWLTYFRLATLGTVSVFALIVLGLSADWISTTQNDFTPPFYDTYAALALAISLLTLFSLPAMLAVDHFRKGAITSQILVEVSVLGVLTILWLATAATSSNAYLNSTFTCLYNYSIVIKGCRETQAISAFSHLNWLWLAFYTSALVALAIISQNNGAPVWRSTVKDSPFVVRKDVTTAPGMYPTDPSKMGQVPVMPQQYPPQQGYVTPQQTGYGQTPQV